MIQGLCGKDQKEKIGQRLRTHCYSWFMLHNIIMVSNFMMLLWYLPRYDTSIWQWHWSIFQDNVTKDSNVVSIIANIGFWVSAQLYQLPHLCSIFITEREFHHFPLLWSLSSPSQCPSSKPSNTPKFQIYGYIIIITTTIITYVSVPMCPYE